MAAPTDIAKLSYEEARNQLVEVVSELEQGSPTLEQTLALWERGEALAARCEEWLVGAKERLNAARAGLDVDETTSASGAGGPGRPGASTDKGAGSNAADSK